MKEKTGHYRRRFNRAKAIIRREINQQSSEDIIFELANNCQSTKALLVLMLPEAPQRMFRLLLGTRFTRWEDFIFLKESVPREANKHHTRNPIKAPSLLLFAIAAHCSNTSRTPAAIVVQ
jgi:hypothetical protein